MGGTKWSLVLLTALSLVTSTGQNVRQKRQILADEPRIITENGHLIFQSGSNRNITFRSGSAGAVFIDNLDLKYAVTLTKTNKESIDRLQNSLTSSSGNVTSRLATLEDQLRPLSGLSSQVNTLSTSVESLRAQGLDSQSSFNTRITHLEVQMQGAQSINDIQTQVTSLRSRVETLENSVNTLRNRDDIPDSVDRRIAALETTVRNLQALLVANECLSNPCMNGGTCVDMYNGYFCRCPPNWQGPRCTEDVNECYVYAGTDMGCQNGATCLNTPGSFSCRCATNWYGIHCSELHNDCTGASHAELCGHGTCISDNRNVAGQPSYRCICENGWTTSSSGPACIVDVDECATGTRCFANPPVQCINIPGSFVCGSCPAGFTGNGYTCSDLDECAFNNGGCSTSPRVACRNTPGSRACGPCPAGYQGDGVTCSYVGLCSASNGGCHPLATCSDNTGGFGIICTCPSGYIGSGVGSSGCQQQSQAGACASNPCQNGAVCRPVGSTSFRCACRPGYSGTTCSFVVDACASNPCHNGGTCTSQTQAPGYSCQCSGDFTGTNCDQAQQECGGNLRGQTGSFRYPRTTGVTYSHRVSCAWVITTSRNKILRVTFSNFSLEAHSECNFDFLQIHDGPSPSAHMIGKYCGSNPPNGGSLNSTHNQLYFWFKSDATVASEGFAAQWTSHTPTCGAFLNGSDHGSISSPGYPGNYPNNRDCVWTIAVSPESNIMIHFAHLALETHANCSFDYLEIRDGETESAPLLGQFCSSESPAPIHTTGPYAFVRFHSDQSLSDRGFHITYAAHTEGRQGCGGRLSAPEGELTSPGYPNPYRHNIQCVWVITVAPFNTVQLTFLDLDLETSTSCSYDFLTVRDGDDQTAPLLGTFCGTDLPAIIPSSGNVINLELHTDESHNGRGFRVTWRTACGGTFSGLEGQIQSPNYPQHYHNDVLCTYLIEVPETNTIRLQFTSFGLEEEDDCLHDYIEIHDGANANAPIRSRLCGDTIPNEVMSTGSYMFIKFATDGSVHNLGFQATFTAVPGGNEGCSRVLNSNTGVVSSPGHPNQYPHGANCTWYINVTPGLVIRLIFHSFSFEQGFQNRCVYDYVEVYDNSTMAEESRLGRYCGSRIPNIVTSSDNSLVVYMQSDSGIAREGFSATFMAINTSTVCGSPLTASTGVITSPNYPNPYPHNKECEWTITIDDGNQILVNITDLDIESHSNCNFDYLELRNGGYLSSPVLHKYCGQILTPQTQLSHSNRLYLRFKSDSVSSGRGFRLEYTSGASGCGGDLTSPTGGIVSPNYPNHYPHNAECYWTITVSQGSTITLFFVALDIEAAGSCYFEYLEIREGGPSGQSLGKLCGSTVPSPITTRSNRMWLSYRSDAFFSGTGFRLQYHANCNTRLTGNRGVIESPNFPNPYYHRANCTWIIDAPMGNKINVAFAAFKLEEHCSFDRLQVRNGGDFRAPELRTMCGSTIPEPFQSAGSQLWLNFISDSSFAHDGFRLEWIVEGCGGHLYGSTGTITSPDYPNNYPHRRECQWVITVDTGNSIELNITNFDLESSTNCMFDVLEVYAGSDALGPQLTQLCHSQTKPQVLHTTGTTAFIRFRSDISVSGHGFRLTYRAVSGGCGGNFTARTATITSINYPQNYEHNTECEWNITVAEGHVVVLNFTDFQLESSSQCNYDYVNLYDGPSSNSTLIASLCSGTLPSPSVYRSNGNQMFVWMRTDISVAHRGFSATYTTGCGGTLNADVDGEIISPGYPGHYSWNTRCVWIISSAFNNRRVSLTITHLDIFSVCTNEYVAVVDGRQPVINQTETLQNVHCGSYVPATITSEGSALTVVFQSANFTSGSGFRAVYSSAYASCGGEFTADAGRFTSPSYPDGYPVNIECVWQIKSSPGNQVQLSFPVFQLDPLGGVNDDYVEIRSPNVSGLLRGRWIGSNAPTNLSALSGVWVKFRSNDDTTAPGFVAEYSNLYGGNLIGDSGQIASPRYPAFYPASSSYRWTVLVSQNMRVRVSFSAFSLERANMDGSCPYDYVQIYDGTQETGVLLGTFCGSTLPDTVYSETNQITVAFTSDNSHQESGFLLNWLAVTPSDIPTIGPSVVPSTPVPGCGGQLVATDTQQNLTSPGYPGQYSNSLDCFWTISVPEGHIVVVNITSIDLESHGSCNFDYIRFRDGDTYYSRTINTYCGRNGVGARIQSTTNVLGITFHTDPSVGRQGFVLTYEIGCGGSLRSSAGVIKSLGYPNNYQASQNCTWKVQVAPGKTIRLDFADQFNIADSGECNNDYLMLLNGFTAQSPPLFINGTSNTNGHYCGSSKPQSLQTSSNFLYVNFVSDGSGENSGFSFTYSAVSVTCGGELRLTTAVTSGYFTSPNYPENYPHNVDCTWVIIGPASERIQVDFEGTFYIEHQAACGFDYIEFHDGGTVNSPRIGSQLCGTTLPGTVLSTGNVLLARFRTDSSVPHAGFKAKYSIATCGGRITAARGVVTSPNYPGNYGNNEDCEWSIVGSVGHYLILNITNFQLQFSNNCSADSLVIRDVNATGTVLFQECGYNTARSIETSDSFAYIRFKSDSSVTASGFRIAFQASLEECGGQLNTPSGVITSPNYPGQYAHRRSCVWDITVPLGRRVTLTFSDLRLDGGRSFWCYWDYVQVFNGYILGSPSLGRFCGETIPQLVESSGNTMRVRFQTDGSISNAGFRATYTSDREAECGGTITDAPGNITSPGFDNRTYSHNIQCIWNFHNRNTNGSIKLYFTFISLEYHPSCVFDYVEIREGVDVNSPLANSYCGNRSNTELLVIPGNDAWVRFRTDVSISHGGFQLMYDFTDCGGVLMDPQGVITSPEYPDNLNQRSVACAWKIVAPDGARIRVNFTDFDYACNTDYLEIQNGGLPDSPTIGRFCGSNSPSSFVSQSNEIRLTMQSAYSFGNTRFRMEYSFETGGCGGLFHSNQGSLSSPNHPSSYPHNVECMWDINVQNGYIITLHFNPPFDLEARECSNDYVEVFDSMSNGSLVSLGRWCHNIEPPDQTSASNRLVVMFRSDATTNGNGFSATWNVVCGGVFTNPHGVLFSPGYPDQYPNNLRCNYTISSGYESHIALHFTDFELEDGYTCRHDSVRVWQGNSSSDDQWHWWYSNPRQRYLGAYCGSTIPGTLLAIGQMSIQFWTDRSVRYKGFRAEYFSEECGGDLTDPYGIITTPHHPNNYLNSVNCSWNITVAPNRIIRFKFQSFNIEAHHQCVFDYLSFFDGPDTSSPMIGRYCGNMQNIPEYVQSTGNQMYINFITDSSETSDGFLGVYWTSFGADHGCGGVFRQSSGNITSVDGDGDGLYEHNLDCEWLIFVEDNKQVTITITALDVEMDDECTWDYLKIYDGQTKDEQELGTFCGQTAPTYQILASSNVVLVVFHTDSRETGAGFNASFQATDALCGGAAYNATTTPQTLTSPNYPNSTGTAFRCSWVIDSGDAHKQVRLTVTDLQLQTSTNCDNEHLNFRDRPMGSTGQQHTYCGSVIPPPFDSKGAQVKINYFKATTSNNRGFQLTYQIADCNRNITLPSGRITSPRFPDLYPVNANCTIQVTSPVGTTLAFYFKSFQIEQHPNCNWDYLEFKNSTSTTVAKLCGYAIPSPIFMTDNMATLRFKTDTSVQHSGYDVTFLSSSQVAGSGCGGNVTGMLAGAFTSPGYPDSFLETATCSWYINPPAGRVLWWRISVISTPEQSGSCDRDYVSVYSGHTTSNPLIERICDLSQQPSSPRLTQGQMLVQYVSSGNGSAPIFRFEFDVDRESLVSQPRPSWDRHYFVG